MHLQEMKVVNGKVVSDRNIQRNVTPEGEHIFGHDGAKKINIRRSFTSHKRRATRKTRRNRKAAKQQR
jgi:hypothetical protein